MFCNRKEHRIDEAISSAILLFFHIEIRWNGGWNYWAICCPRIYRWDRWRLRDDSHWGVPKSSIWMERRRVAMHFRDVFGLPWFLKMHLDMSPRFCSTSNIFVNSVYYCAFVMQKMQLEACGPKHHTVLMIYRCWWGRSKDEQMACYRFTSNACANAEKRSSVHFGWVSKQHVEWEYIENPWYIPSEQDFLISTCWIYAKVLDVIWIYTRTSPLFSKVFFKDFGISQLHSGKLT